MGDDGGDATMRTPRLVLAPWRPEDAQALLDIRSRPEVARWLGDPTVWTELGRAHEAIEAWAARTDDESPLGVWAIRPGGRGPVGTVSLGRLPGDTESEVEIGWHLHPDATGHGFAREAAAAVLAHGLTSGVPRIWAIMWSQNAASAAVAAAIGMVDLGVVEDPWYGSPSDPMSRMFRAPT